MKIREFRAKISHFEAILKRDILKFERVKRSVGKVIFTGSLVSTTPLGSNGSVLWQGLKF